MVKVTSLMVMEYEGESCMIGKSQMLEKRDIVQSSAYRASGGETWIAGILVLHHSRYVKLVEREGGKPEYKRTGELARAGSTKKDGTVEVQRARHIL